jgi:hypothetical protein
MRGETPCDLERIAPGAGGSLEIRAAAGRVCAARPDVPAGHVEELKGSFMKRLVILSMLVGGFGLPVLADKIEGEAMCAKCSMKEMDKCCTAIKTDSGVVYCEKNDVSKAFHKQICEENKKVTAEGTIAEKDGKKWITLEKIEVAK